MRDEVALLAELIRNRCVNDGTPDSGHEARSVATLAAFLGGPGRVFEPHPGRQSAVYRVPGTAAGAPALMLMGHLDVVPANPAGWSRDPFGGEVVDGVVWGRGAVDMLNLTAAMAACFRRYLGAELEPLPGDLVFLAVADEEAGGELGADYLLRHHPEAVACDYLLTEIAYPAIVTPAGPSQPVTTAEKGPFWRRVTIRGEPGHASLPYRRANAVADMGTVIARLAEAATPVVITPEWEETVAALGLDPALAADLVDPDRVDRAIERLAADDEGLARLVHALTHLTVSPNVVAGGTKANVVADLATAEVDIRALPGQDEDDVIDHLSKSLGSELYDRLHLEPVMDYPAGASPATGPLWEAIGDGLETVAGSRRRFPMLIPGTTDARFFRSRGVVAYGVGAFEPGLDLGEFLGMFHGNDERISARSVELTADLLAETVAAFGRRSRSLPGANR